MKDNSRTFRANRIITEKYRHASRLMTIQNMPGVEGGLLRAILERPTSFTTTFKRDEFGKYNHELTLHDLTTGVNFLFLVHTDYRDHWRPYGNTEFMNSGAVSNIQWAYETYVSIPEYERKKQAEKEAAKREFEKMEQIYASSNNN